MKTLHIRIHTDTNVVIEVLKSNNFHNIIHCYLRAFRRFIKIILYLLNLLANSTSWHEISEALRARGRFCCTTEPLLLKNSFLLMEAVERLKVSVTVVEERRKNLEDPRILKRTITKFSVKWYPEKNWAYLAHLL